MRRPGLDVPVRPMSAVELLTASADSDRRHLAKFMGLAAAPA